MAKFNKISFTYVTFILPWEKEGGGRVAREGLAFFPAQKMSVYLMNNFFAAKTKETEKKVRARPLGEQIVQKEIDLKPEFKLKVF